MDNIDARIALSEALIDKLDGLPNGSFIERQEARGQQNLINSTALPKKGNWQRLTAWGIQRLDDVDKLFCNAVLPEGWAKEATEHSMWSNLKDERGLIRASIFYKAAFYDRDASISVRKRFSVSKDYDHKNGEWYVVNDNGLDRTVYRAKGGQYAVRNFTPGFQVDEYFYPATSVVGGYSQAHFGDVIHNPNPSLIDDDTFYREFNHIETLHYLINASEKLAVSFAQQWLDAQSIPDDGSEWNCEYDFPAV